MSSTTGSKKDIVDFLWEWAETQGEWAKLLTDSIVSSESSLEPEQRRIVFNYFLQNLGLHSGLPKVTAQKPEFRPAGSIIELSSLSNITGVNKLAKNQTILFGKNLSVIYGNNGTGKSSYSRILKSLGFSYDCENLILPNIYGKEEPKSASILYKVDGDEKEFQWDGEESNEDLEHISVFNNNCVRLSLSDNRQLIVSPIGFHLFNLTSSELDELLKLLNRHIDNYQTDFSWTNLLNTGTPQKIFIDSISAFSMERKLNELSSFDNQKEDELERKRVELLNLNRRLLQTEIDNLNQQINELTLIISKIELVEKNFTFNEWDLLNTYNQKIDSLKGATLIKLQDIAEKNDIEFYQTNEFKSFITAAEDYIKIINNLNYPEADGLCIYCQQPLNDSAKNLITNYRKLLNDKTQESLKLVESQKSQLFQRIACLDASLTIHHRSFGLDEDQKVIQPKQLSDYNNSVHKLKSAFLESKVLYGADRVLDCVTCKSLLTAKKQQLFAEKENKVATLADLGVTELELTQQISELKDRKLLSTKIPEIKLVIKNHIEIRKLREYAGCFNTLQISRKTSEARDYLVRQNFNEKFQDELKQLRKSDIRVELNFATLKGTNKISQKMASSYLLTDILSEGEQKAIALAEFLTELQLDNTMAPVIFDDPVNSLDHYIIDDVSRRLIKLSKERQVVIFTHSILLFNSLVHFSEQPAYKTLDYKFYNTRNEFEATGFISEAEELNSIKSYLTKINLLLNNTPKDRKEADLAEDGYSYLRSAIELCVEHEIFHGTIKRYQKNVAFTSFLKISGNALDQYKEQLNEIFERCCGYIKAHSNPVEIFSSPTLEELKTDFEAFQAIRSNFKK